MYNQEHNARTGGAVMSKTNKPIPLDKAASILGISKDALRKRIQRGSLEAVKDKAGKWLVIIPDSGKTNGQDAGGTSLDNKDTVQDASGQLKALQDQIAFLQQELERKDHLMMALMQKLPMIEAPKKTGLFAKIFKHKQTNGN